MENLLGNLQKHVKSSSSSNQGSQTEAGNFQTRQSSTKSCKEVDQMEETNNLQDTSLRLLLTSNNLIIN